jgi:hypothetical protein
VKGVVKNLAPLPIYMKKKLPTLHDQRVFLYSDQGLPYCVAFGFSEVKNQISRYVYYNIIYYLNIP